VSKPVLLLDMDGPLADFDLAFFEVCAAYNIEFNCTLEDRTHRFATDHIASWDQKAFARSLVEADINWFEDLPMTEGADLGLKQLDYYFDVWIVTKPLHANRTCRDGKARWVEKHLGKEWVEKLILAPDKSMIRGDILLDDAPHPDWVDRASWKPVIFTAPFNGEGSKWGQWPQWTWGDDINVLLEAAK
jgi:5'-nucleotidase